MKLIPMIDFVLEQNKPGLKYLMSMDKCIRYAKFLKQPLVLGMIIPCDENNNPLPEPQMKPERKLFDEEDMDYDAQELYDYIQAKEKVLFKGFSIRTESKKTFVGIEGYEIEILILSKLTIEDLASDWNHIELTESAIKQIEL